MNFGFVKTIECVNVVPPPDTRCADPSFALANPEVCPSKTELIIKPSVSLVCALGSTQFGAFLLTDGVERDVTSETIFSTSNPLIAVVGAASGNATGMSQGRATIGAAYEGYTATAEMNVMGNTSDCCSEQQVAMMVLVDTSRSMSQAFSGAYTTRLDYAKAAATQFISEVNSTKDIVGLMTFNKTDATVLSSPTSDTDAVEALVDTISQTQEKTEFYDAMSLAVDELDATAADLKVIVLISDGEDTSDGAGNNYIGASNPITFAGNFRSAGGIIICMGCRASGAGFALMSEFSTGGFFVNSYFGIESASLDYLSGLKGYICAGNCTPAGDTIVGTPKLDYTDFINWDVSGGSVDLIGTGMFDFLPGNGLYVDLAGSTNPLASYGKLTSKVPFAVTAGSSYRLSLQLAGNQRVDLTPFAVTAKVYYLAGTTEVPLLTKVISINDYVQGFQPYSFSFVSPATTDVYISIQQTSYPEGAGLPPLTEFFAMLLGIVQFDDLTLNKTLLLDNFDDENLQYIPPACGLGTTWYSGGYVTGYNCYGTGCLDQPIPIQLPDPNPLANIESGGTPPKTFTSTKTACAECPAGEVNVEDATTPTLGALIPAMTDYTAPSGEVTSSGENASPGTIGGLAWHAFDSSLESAWYSDREASEANPIWIAYEFDDSKMVAAYSINMFLGQFPGPKSFAFQGSHDGINWTTLDSQTGVAFSEQHAEWKTFALDPPAIYPHFRLYITEQSGPVTISQANPMLLFGLQLFTSANYTLGPTQVCKSATATSTVSQEAADYAAYNAAYALAQAELDCRQVFTAPEEVTLHCPCGTCGPDVTRSATGISYISQLDAENQARIAATAAAQAVIDADCAESDNTHAIILPVTNWNQWSYGPASPFPSVQYVEDEGAISKVTVTIEDLQPCPNGNSFLFILMGPDGTAVLLWADQGTRQFIPGEVTITFDDAGDPMQVGPDSLVSGTYFPNHGNLQPVLGVPASAPQPDYAFALSAFVGKEMQGAWSLWVVLRTNRASSIASGWYVTIT